MIKSGDDTVAGSLVPVSERAANWKAWGNRILRIGDPDLPRGAVVVLRPTEGTNASGHVTFLNASPGADSMLACLGGNQSDSLNISPYPRSQVAAIRWLDLQGATPQVEGDEELIVTQTLYGEARGEEEEGRIAVANVIMNRLKANKPFYGRTTREICLKELQFSCWNPNDENRAIITDAAEQGKAAFVECLTIARRALAEELDDVTGGATHFHATGMVKPDWALAPGSEITRRIGKRIFYRNVD